MKTVTQVFRAPIGVDHENMYDPTLYPSSGMYVVEDLVVFCVKKTNIVCYIGQEADVNSKFIEINTEPSKEEESQSVSEEFALKMLAISNGQKLSNL